MKKQYSPKQYKKFSTIFLILAIVSLIIGIPTFAFGGFIFVIIACIALYFSISYKKLSNKPNQNQIQQRENDIIFTQDDFEQFSLPYQIPVFSSEKGNESALNKNNQFQALTDINTLNFYLNEAKEIANISSELNICTEDINFEKINESQSKLVFTPYTKTGKKSKYPLMFRFFTHNFFDFDDSSDSYRGEIYYMQDGNIGKARIICRTNGIYVVNIGLIGTSLKIKSIKNTGANGIEKTLYKV